VTDGMVKPTRGHHFSSLLRCPRQAYFDYHGDPREKRIPPAYLRKMQLEGLELEGTIESDFYPEAVRLPKKYPEHGVKDTIAAMHAGAPVILQAGLFRHGENVEVGVADILQLVRKDPSLPLGHEYRVGEIKRSAALKTAHVMQVMFYSELLAELQGIKPKNAFFHLGVTSIHEVVFAPYEDFFNEVWNELKELIDQESAPAPHLAKLCQSCPWRGACIPEMVDSRHLSMLPRLTRTRVNLLNELGVTRWDEVSRLSADTASRLGMSLTEWESVIRSADNLSEGRPVFRSAACSMRLDNATVVDLDVEFAKTESDPVDVEDDSVVVKAVRFITPNATSDIVEVQALLRGDLDARVKWDSLLQSDVIVLFGVGKRATFVDLAVHLSGKELESRAVFCKTVDLCSVLRDKVHLTSIDFDV